MLLACMFSSRTILITVSLLLLVSMACLRSPSAEPPITVQAPTMTPTIAPTPVISQVADKPTPAMVSIDVSSFPREAGSFVLNPKPLGESEYVRGMEGTLAAVDHPGWNFVEWVGPVFGVQDKTARITMDTTQMVMGVFEKVESTDDSPVAAIVVATNQAPTATPMPTPTPSKSSELPGVDWIAGIIDAIDSIPTVFTTIA